MAERGKSKGIIEVVLEKKKKDNVTPYWLIIIDGKEYYDSKGEFKDKKGQEVEFEWSDSNDGNIRFINAVGGYKGGGGGFRGKSPEEITLQKKAFSLSYAKDQTDCIIASFGHLVKELPEGMKYLEFLSHVREVASTMTIKTSDEFLKKLNE
jgi:hypothetical protein